MKRNKQFLLCEAPKYDIAALLPQIALESFLITALNPFALLQISNLVSGEAGAWTLAVLQYVGVVFYHFVNLAIVANYAASCELLRSLIHSLASQLQGKSISLK